MQDLQIEGVLETCLYVDDLRLAELFYRDTLGLALTSSQEGRHLFFRLPRGMLLIFDPRQSADSASSLPPHGAVGGGHVAFSVNQSDLPAWQDRLAAANVEIEQIVEWPTGGRSIYFRDPANNSLELTSPSIWGIADGA